MRIKNQSVFRDIERLVSRKTDIPATSHILFELSGGDLMVSATDCEVMLTARVEAEAIERPELTSFLVPGKPFLAALDSGEEVDVDIGDSFLNMKTTSGKYRIPTLPGSDFPSFVREGKAERVGDFDFSQYKSTIKRATYATGEECPDFTALGLVYLDFISDEARVVTTDGHRMAMGSLKSSGIAETSALISLREAKMIASSSLDQGTIFKSSSYLILKDSNKEYLIRTLNGSFPDYKKIFVEQDRGKVVGVDRESFLGALVRLKNITGSGKVLGGFSQDKVILSAPDGDGIEDMPSKGDFSGDILFNSAFLIDALRQTKEDVRLIVVGPLAPMFIIAEGYTAMIMPMRTK